MMGRLLQRGEPASGLGVQRRIPLTQPRIDPDGAAESGRQHLLHAERVRGNVGQRPSRSITGHAGHAVGAILDEQRPHLPRQRGQPPGRVLIDRAKRMLHHHRMHLLVAPQRHGLHLGDVNAHRVGAHIRIPRSQPAHNNRIDRRAAGEQLGEHRAVATNRPHCVERHLHAVPCLEDREPVLRPRPGAGRQRLTKFRESPCRRLFHDQPRSIGRIRLISMYRPPAPGATARVTASSHSAHETASHRHTEYVECHKQS